MAERVQRWALWYRQPAPVEPPTTNAWRDAPGWTRALPIGNGRIGATVYGGVDEERIQLNEETLWSGEPYDADSPDAPRYLSEIRRLLFEGRYAQAQQLALERFVCRGAGSGHGNGANVPFGCYQMLGDLRLRFPDHQNPQGYYRELNLQSAIVTVQYRTSDLTVTREHFASAPDNVIVVRIVGNRRGRLNLEASLSRPEHAHVRAEGNNQLVLFGQLYHERWMRYAARLQVSTEGGSVSAEGNVLRVQGANAIILFLSAATDYRGHDPFAESASHLRQAIRRPYAELKRRHVQDYQRFFRRVRLDLGGQQASNLPTDERLERVRRGEHDPHLCALYFQFGRYLLISSSRPGNLPANLQGIWADGIQTPWNCDYHTNINVQMNYWIAEVGNLSECHLPLIDFINRLREPGRKTARVHYGLDGWVVHTVTNVWGFTAPGEHPLWGQFPAAAGWLCQHVWEHYAFHPDEAYLRRAYPIMKEAAQFFLRFLVPEPKHGWLVTAPSTSPENSFRTPDGQVAAVCYAPTLDMQILRELFTNCIEASRILGVDEEFRRQLADARDRLAPMQIGKHGQLQEWIEDFDEPEPGHRHMSHLYGLHPGNQITLRGTPALARAARVSLERRLAHGGGHTGWSRAWLINFAARLEDGDRAYEHLHALLAKSTLPNLFDTHPPFQIDGNFGGAAGIAEMLVQSHGGEVHFLPALPRAWSDGTVDGLRVRGGAEVHIVWRGGRAQEATLRARHSTTFRLRPPKGQPIAEVSSAGRRVPVQQHDDGTVSLNVVKGRSYRIVFAG